MNKYLSALAIAVALSGCSSSDSDGGGTTGGTTTTGTTTTGTTTTGTTTTGTTTTGTTTTGTTTTGTTDGDAVTPSGDINGAWFGNNNFGDGVMIIDANSNIYSFAANTQGQYETAFGPASEQLQRFIHRDSDNPASADSFTLAGDLPSQLTTNEADNFITYNLAVGGDGQSISNTVAGNEFSMTFATGDDLAPISLDSIAGNWVANSSFCAAPPESCNLQLQVTFTAAGAVTGATQFGGASEPFSEGTVSVATGATQYLNVSFTWTEKRRSGVVHVDRNDPTRLILNTFGPADTEGESRSLTARLTRQ